MTQKFAVPIIWRAGCGNRRALWQGWLKPGLDMRLGGDPRARLMRASSLKNFLALDHPMTMFLIDGPEQARVTVLLAHGAGAAMDSAAMAASAKVLTEAGLRVARFEFDYMASRRTSAGRRPPPRADKLMPEYIAAVDALDVSGPLIIGGKSMGVALQAWLPIGSMHPAGSQDFFVLAIRFTRRKNLNSCALSILLSSRRQHSSFRAHEIRSARRTRCPRMPCRSRSRSSGWRMAITT